MAFARSYFNCSRADDEDNDETLSQTLVFWSDETKINLFENQNVRRPKDSIPSFALQRRRLLHHIIYLLSYDLGLFRVVELPIL